MSTGPQRNVLEKMASFEYANLSAPAALRRLTGRSALANSSISQSVTSWRVGLDFNYIPLPFRSMGMLWWFQALTTYFVRIRKPWRQRILGHPAVNQLLNRFPASMHRSDSLRRREANTPWRVGFHEPNMTTCADVSGVPRCYGHSLFTELSFDVGLHIRLGDACRVCAAADTEQHMRMPWWASLAVSNVFVV